ncbi:phosphoglycerate dehydrogenase [Coccomyxa subellipsoidea C-169]|uniref:D-3-phosphoglycerate dehydrogenase n=1 Tax=Coccomyxa subellipsoidea (strain C-169) TaxID=574566 RepID=I0Z1J3_COCSC|nr:phosphoglycerate dehydrogenase [Coccomyxa subellipsoidea C-169]EIE24512.1 phosphoglycerate dehydrogenase [Coccomyxa subellipsoidea C-169]|eukprot:XP_005649056.1 phosphoglycerate dehydrogenase [Coccomyxa subellipsoidea C-169]
MQKAPSTQHVMRVSGPCRIPIPVACQTCYMQSWNGQERTSRGRLASTSSQVCLVPLSLKGPIQTPTRSSRLQATPVVAVAAPERPTILVTEELGEPGIDLLSQHGDVEKAYDLTPEQLCERIATADALIIRSATQVTKEVFEASKGRLKVVGRAGVGVDNHGCLVVNAPTANTIAAAEHGIALICALSRNVAQADASVKAGKWARSKYVGVSIVGKTLCIMGFGKVGSEVARRGIGLGFASVIAYDPYASEVKAQALGVKLVSWEEALAQGDFFSLHMPMTPQTKGIFNDDTFSKMKRGARVINVARGGVIDEPALVRALDAGIVAQAALDVFVKEPPPADNPLVGREDVVCTPHLGASTTEAQEGVSVEIAEAVVSALKGELAATAVNAPMVPAEVLAELQPFVALALGLGRAAVQLTDKSARILKQSDWCADDLDTRLLRAMVIKGILEQITTANVNLVNADLLAKNRGLRIIESTVPAEGKEVLKSLRIALGSSDTRFSAALGTDRKISVTGTVKGAAPYLTRIGTFDVDLSLDGIILLTRQKDQPGVISAVSTVLAEAGVNISFMSVSVTPDNDAVMALGLDMEPTPELLAKLPSLKGITEFAMFSEKV